MATDDLTTPLGQAAKPRRRFRLPVSPLQAFAALLAAVLAGFAALALFNDNPFGGEPSVRIAVVPPESGAKSAPNSAITKADSQATAAKSDPVRSEPARSEQARPPASGQTVTIIDGSKGTRQEVPVGPGNGSSAASTAVEQSVAESAQPAVMNGIDQRLLESSRHGMVPVASGGLKASRAYAGGNDATRAKAATMPAIAIVITGLGVGAAKTNDATMKLPGAVTLAFTPYGTEPGKLVERARAQGHEVLLQIPMEPLDYPDNDPGPQTLLTTLTAEQNLDRLMWHLSRFQGYVGLANFMGARFVGADTSLQPVLKEAAKRGLAFFDDGSVSRSVAGTIAEGQAMPFARADVMIDAVSTPAEVDKALAKLEGLAKQRGVAVGVASALPVSIERIAAWSKALESRGIVLAPLTSAMLKAKSS